MKHLKSKIIKYMKINSDANFSTMLKESVDSYNKTFSKVLNGSQSNFNSNFYDPVLRERLYGHHQRLQPFGLWYKAVSVGESNRFGCCGFSSADLSCKSHRMGIKLKQKRYHSYLYFYNF